MIIRPVNIWIMFYCIEKSHWCIYNTRSKSDWLFNTPLRVLQADWLILENNEKATSNINMPYFFYQYYFAVVACTYEGLYYKDGDKFSSADRCRSCVCERGNVRCDSPECPATECDNPYKKPGSCCPTCSEGEIMSPVSSKLWTFCCVPNVEALKQQWCPVLLDSLDKQRSNVLNQVISWVRLLVFIQTSLNRLSKLVRYVR